MSVHSDYLAPVRIAFRKHLPNPDDAVVLGDPTRFLGHIYLRWLPADRVARVSVVSRPAGTTAESDVLDFEAPADAGAKVVSLLRRALETYQANQDAAIAEHLRDMAAVAMPHLMIPLRKGFRPVSASRVHAEFKSRVFKEAATFNSVVSVGLQQLVVAGWSGPTYVELPEFEIPNPWK